MVIRDSVRIKSDGKGKIRITIHRDGKVIEGVLEYSFKDGEIPLKEVETEEVADDGE